VLQTIPFARGRIKGGSEVSNSAGEREDACGIELTPVGYAVGPSEDVGEHEPVAVGPRYSLALANQTRTAGAAVKREITAGKLTVPDALEDPRAGGLTALAVLMATPYVGPTRARQMLRRTRIGESRRVRHLTDRERAAVAQEARQWAANGARAGLHYGGDAA
jgi:hypothetical protein